MDEQRAQDYLKLIEELLNCPDGQEVEVLQANSTLIDQGLVQMMGRVAEQMAKADEPNAEWLQKLAAQIAEALNQWEQLNQQAVELYGEGRWEEGITVAEQALELALSLYRGDHPNVVINLNNLAVLYNAQGRYEEAERLYKQALEMTQRLFKGNHPNVAINLNNLAALYNAQGRYEEAERLYKQALEMTQRLFKGNHPNVAINLNNLAALYNAQGRYEEAERLYKQALEMTQRLFKGDHPNVATSLSNLAALYDSQERYEEAERLYKQALEMKRRLFKGDHLDVAISLNNLAFLYKPQGRYEEAERLYKQALEMTQRLFKGNHPNVAISLNNLAFLYKYQGRYEEAERLYKQALEMTQRLFRGDHLDVAVSLNNLAVFLAGRERYTEALRYLKTATEVEERIIRRVFAASVERKNLDYLQTLRKSLDVLLSLVWKHLMDSPLAVQTALDVVLQRKLLMADALATFNYAIYSGRYPHLKQEFEQFRALNAELLHLTYSPPLTEPGLPREEFQSRRATHQQHLNELEIRYEQLEKRLRSQVPEIQLQESTRDRRAVALELPEESALVEFVQFRVFDFTAVRGEPWQAERYVAFILPARQPEVVQMVDLGKAEHIDRLIRVFRQGAARPGNLLGMASKNRPLVDSGNNLKTGIELRRAIYDPLKEAVGAYPHLYIAADGNMNLLPLQLLPKEETGQRLLLDEHTLSYLSVGRDILRRKFETKRPAVEALILADPDFDLGRVTEEVKPKGAKPQEELAQTASVSENLLNTLAGKYFKRVGRTRLLAERVAQKLGTKPYLQAEALEPYLTSSACPRILLIATHGHFSELEEQELNLYHALLACPNGGERQVLQSYRALLDWDLCEWVKAVGDWLEENGEPEDSKKMQVAAADIVQMVNEQSSTLRETDRLAAARVKNPMMRSGLALAGANTWRAGGTLPAEAGKGYVFALDVARSDLWANELTVLLACQSGMGEIEIGEGVSGLRRAFAVAGAKTLVMSLWDVPERASVLLMERFFDNLERGQGRAEALQEAQSYVRGISVRELQESALGIEVLEEFRRLYPKVSFAERLNYKPLEHPFYWGAWICQGDTTALPKL